MTRETRKTIARAFYALGDRRGGISALDLAYGGIAVRTDADKVIEGSAAGRKEEEIIDALDASSSPWLEVYRKTYDFFRWTQKDALMRLKFAEKKRAQEIMIALSLPGATYYRWLAEIYDRAELWATELGIFRKKMKTLNI